MHELGIVYQVVKRVTQVAKENEISAVDTIVLQIGELSSIVPRYIEACFPAAIDGTFLENTKLKIEIIPGKGYCRECNTVFNILEEEGICPDCHGRGWDTLSGKEFFIKEILVGEPV